jgi:transcriptional regulator with PAS, ATPase and Fis domain
MNRLAKRSGSQSRNVTSPASADKPTDHASLVQRLRDSQAFANLLGEAPTFLEAIKNLPAVAKSDGTVLINGETGTGKELVARSIHYLSDRAAFPFVPINCGSLPDSLLETELFGHERGAFTGAHARREGLIIQAQRGTLFLDEVGTLPAKATCTSDSASFP